MNFDRSASRDGYDRSVASLETDRLRLEDIADEIRLLAKKIPEAGGRSASDAVDTRTKSTDDATINASDVRRLVRARRIREEFFPQIAFADPAWDILLTLFEAELAGIRVMVSGVCASAAVPQTTALRWIGHLVDRKIIEKHDDPTDRRRQFVSLMPATSQTLRRYFARVGSAGA